MVTLKSVSPFNQNPTRTALNLVKHKDNAKKKPMNCLEALCDSLQKSESANLGHRGQGYDRRMLRSRSLPSLLKHAQTTFEEACDVV